MERSPASPLSRETKGPFYREGFAQMSKEEWADRCRSIAELARRLERDALTAIEEDFSGEVRQAHAGVMATSHQVLGMNLFITPLDVQSEA